MPPGATAARSVICASHKIDPFCVKMQKPRLCAASGSNTLASTAPLCSEARSGSSENRSRRNWTHLHPITACKARGRKNLRLTKRLAPQSTSCVRAPEHQSTRAPKPPLTASINHVVDPSATRSKRRWSQRETAIDPRNRRDALRLARRPRRNQLSRRPTPSTRRNAGCRTASFSEARR